MIVSLFGKSFVVSLLFILMLPLLLISSPYSKHEYIKVGNRTIKAYIADNAISRSIGYMFRDPADVEDDEGILFVYDKPVDESFWMFNVHFPILLHTLKETEDGYAIVKTARLTPHSVNATNVSGRHFLEVKARVPVG